MLDRSIKPTPTGRIKFIQPKIETFVLDNSLTVYFNKKETLPIIQINILIPSGSIYNPKGKEGLSKLTSTLLEEGADDLSGFEISDKLELLGSILNITSNKEFSTISLLSLAENFEKSLQLISKIILKPTFADEDFERQKLNLITKNIQLDDDPSYVASNEFNKIIFLNSPYQSSSTGVNDAIEKLTNSDIKDFFINRYLPNGSFIILVGNLKQKDSIKILNNYFKDWQVKESKNFDVSITKTKKKIILIDKPSAAQSELRIGHFSTGRNSEDFYAKTILNSILGGQFSSRINLNLREDKGFTYGAHSNFNYNAAGGSFVVSTSIKTENTAEAIKEILFELKNIKDSVTQEELDFAKSYLIRRYPSLFETYSQMASNISLLPIFNLPVNYFENYINEINKVTIGEVANAAEHNINFEKLITVVVGNKKLVKDQLTKFDSFNTELEEI